ncbi:inheritance of peroxisomes protein 1-domain-containing protein [Xylariomycetidae sp. FL2044]|nr:inheritance of peroxisomes protein 1-domain-containing protein [Xylariomycetidae sp. FL2044]
MEARPFATTNTSEMPPPRRVVTAPVSYRQAPPTSRSSPSSSSRSEDLVETLYSHPTVKIIAFTSTQPSPLSSRSGLTQDVSPGTLPASSRLERTIAVGPFRIYRAPGSVAFLSCGSALQPILPKSQCWCIDEVNSRFVLQIRRPQYWRIELPVSEAEDVDHALVLREVFDKILLFEKTECPFQRSFTVHLPQRPQTPVKKKAWTAAGKNFISTPFSPELSPPIPQPRAVSRERRATITTSEPTTPELTVPPTRENNDAQEKKDANENLVARVGSESEADPTNTDEPGNRKTHPEAVPGKSVDAVLEDGRDRDVPQAAGKKHLDHDEKLQAAPLNNGRVGNATENRNVAAGSIGSQPGSSRIQETMTNVVQKNLAPSLGKKQARAGNAEPRGLSTSEMRGAQEPDKSNEVPAVMEPVKSSKEDMTRIKSCNISSIQETDINSRQREKEEVLGSDDDEPSTFEGSGHVAPVNLTKKRVGMLASRSFTAPPQLTLVTSPPSKSKSGASAEVKPLPPAPPQDTASDETSPVGSTDSFHSVQSWHSPLTPLPPSPPSSRPITPSAPQFPYPHQNIILSQTLSHVKNVSDRLVTPVSDATVVPSSAGATVNTDECESPMPRSPASVDEQLLSPTTINEIVEATQTQPQAQTQTSALEERPQIRHRPRSNNMSISQRGLSPLPPAANLFSPPSRRQTQQSRLEAVRRLPVAIVHKTVEILLSPPGHLVSLMLKVAARIAAGEWRGLVFGFGEGGEKIPVQWDYSDGEFSSWDDHDDYTMASLRRPGNSESTPRTGGGSIFVPSTGNSTSPLGCDSDEGRSWEVD